MHHVISETESVARRLRDRLSTCTEGWIATAFFTYGAFDELRDAIEDALGRGAKLTFLLGRYDYVTEPRAVKALLRLGKRTGARLRAYFDDDFLFHYKLALFRDEGRPVVIIGSSNVTPKGLSSRGEVNVEIVNERPVYIRLRRDVAMRVQRAIEAERGLPEYERGYRRFRRLRAAMDRVNAKAARKPSGKRGPGPLKLDPAGNRQLVYCNTSGFEDDPKITQGTERLVAKTRKEGISLPNVWVRVPRAEYGLYERGRQFLSADDDHRIIGLACCMQKTEVLDSHSRRAYIVFYRYVRGRKHLFRNRSGYLKYRAAMRAGDKVKLGAAAMRTASRVLRRLQRMGQRRDRRGKI